MARRRNARTHTALGLKAFETMWTAPLVVGLRLSRIAAAGGSPSARDKAEVTRMGAEKASAFTESWLAAGNAMVAAQQRAAMSLMTAWWNPGNYLDVAAGRVPRSVRSVLGSAANTAAAVTLAATTPVHRRVTANARRLRKGG